MGLETASYVNQLNPSNPAATDPVGLGFDHLALIKQALVNSFPNIAAPVTASPSQLNFGTVPVGMISMFWGSTAPANWAPCDGGSYAKSDGSGNITTPDLRGLFPVATTTTVNGTPAASSLALGATGGAASNTPTITNTATTLDQTMIPAHTHTVTDPGHVHPLTDPGHAHVTGNAGSYNGPSPIVQASDQKFEFSTALASLKALTGVTIASATTGISLASTGGGQPHNHAATSTAVPTVPPFMALMFIMRV